MDADPYTSHPIRRISIPLNIPFPSSRRLSKRDTSFVRMNPPQEFARLVLEIAAEAVTPQIARNQFRHCHIRAV